MPKSVTTFLGLVLVAVSIGVNTWRFPIVLRMAGPSTTPAPADPMTAPPVPTSAAEPAKPAAKEPEPVAPPPVLATKTEMKPESAVAEKPAAVPAPVPEAKPPLSVIPSATGSPAAVADNLEALVPVPKVAAVGKPVPAKAEVVVRRLPPVDPNEQPAGYTATLSGGGVRIYPSTGMQ